MNKKFFKEELEQALSQLQVLQHKKTYNGMYRLICAAVILILIYQYTYPFEWYSLLLIPFLVLFSYLVRRDMSLNRRVSYWSSRRDVCEREIRIAQYDITSFIGGKRHEEAEHPFSVDLDLFGHKSIFQYINRTTTPGGEKWLAKRLKNPFTNIERIKARQESIRIMMNKPLWLLNFCTLGNLVEYKTKEDIEIKQFLNEPIPYAKKRSIVLLVLIFPFIQFILLLLSIMGYIPYSIIAITSGAALTFALSNNKKISAIQDIISSKSTLLARYSTLFKVMEDVNIKSDELSQMQKGLFVENTSASFVIGRLSKMLDRLDYRRNLIVGLALNILFLWDFRQLIAIEKWRSKYQPVIPKWMELLHQTDAMVSFSLFAFSNKDRVCFPEVVKDGPIIQAKSLKHPLIEDKQCIGNGIDIEQMPSFLVVTGANMAGKSTYLRTVGINFVFANIGIPVFAESFTFTPTNLFTSLRTNDSLTQNESYFFAELKRLKMIIDRLNKGERMFIILDEILKGTNSKDKQHGSISLVKQLIRHSCVGIIATHDLILGELANEFPDQVRNYCFEADIEGENLTFSYKIKQGIAHNMNACFLMKKMGIIVE
ncbi:MAG: MutS-related protein [Bacteroidales bacterium]